jgi:hypothetical protein
MDAHDRRKALIYEADGCHVVAFNGWEKNQPLRFRRGARSQLPPPPGEGDHWTHAPVDTVSKGPLAHLGRSSTRTPARGSSLDLELPGEVQNPGGAEAREQTFGKLPAARWLDQVFVETYGREPEPSSREKLDELVELAELVGANEVRRVMREKKPDSPKRLGFFVMPLRALVVSMRPARPSGAVCSECGVGGGLHLEGCELAACVVSSDEVKKITPAFRDVA